MALVRKPRPTGDGDDEAVIEDSEGDSIEIAA